MGLSRSYDQELKQGRSASICREANAVSVSKSQFVIVLERELQEVPSSPEPSCIYRVPEILRNGNEEAYTPQVISIGPYHFSRRNNLYRTRVYKIRYLKSFLERTNNDLDTYVQKVQELEGKVREYYNEDIGLNSNEMVQMILEDGIFLVEFLIRIADQGAYEDDEIFTRPSLRDDIIHDLILLENQLPLFVLKALYKVFYNDDDGWITIRLFIFCNLYYSWDTTFVKRILVEQSVVLWNLQNKKVNTKEATHLLDFFYDICVAKPSGTLSATSSESNFELSSSATELQEAMVKLERADQDKVFTNIQFPDIWLNEDKTLRIPHLLVNRHTETLFRNVIAYEHCHRKGHVFRSYVILMDCLINTPKDVELLIKLGIIKNFLGESAHVCNLFNNLYKITMMHSQDFGYAGVCEKLNKYSRDRWFKCKATCFRWKVTLTRDYFGSPWSIISVIAAIILLGLTITQTVTSIKGTKW